MKRIDAVIKPSKLGEVKASITALGIGLDTSNRQASIRANYGADLPPKILVAKSLPGGCVHEGCPQFVYGRGTQILATKPRREAVNRFKNIMGGHRADC